MKPEENIVYSLIAGDGITISGDPQNPTISVDVPEATAEATTGVTSIQELEGDVSFESGDNITITKDGNKIKISSKTFSSGSTLSESEIEAMIFDGDNTGTLSTGTLALSTLTYTGILPSAVLSG